ILHNRYEKKKYKKITVILMCALLITAVGCSKRKSVDMGDITSEATENTGEYEISTDKSSIKESLGVPDVWQEDIATSVGDSATVRIYAEVIVPDISDVKVLEVKQKEADREFWEPYINKMGFDEIQYLGNYFDDEATIRAKLAKEGCAGVVYSGEGYLAKRNNLCYIVSFSKEGLLHILTCEPCDRSKFPQKCSIEFDALEQTVYDELEKMGITGFKMASIHDTAYHEIKMDGSGMGAAVDGGYVVTLEKCVDGVRIASRDYFHNNIFDFKEREDASEVTYLAEYAEEFIRLEINDEGIVYMEYFAPSDVTEIKASNVKLLDFEQVQQVYRNIIINSQVDKESIVLLKKLEFAYFKVPSKDDVDTGSIIPVWILSDGESDCTRFIIINAIDGTVFQTYRPVFNE
ncbi:MAG: hypothetical protein K2G45_12330, partial [Lachnospiraceae bacterium]|nr:hypothetical protein [Lachnospiraceae bacterium]